VAAAKDGIDLFGHCDCLIEQHIGYKGNQDGNITTGKCRPLGFKRRLDRKHGSVVLAFVVDEWFMNFLRRQGHNKNELIQAQGKLKQAFIEVARRFLYDDSLLSDLLWLLASLAGLAVNWFNMVANDEDEDVDLCSAIPSDHDMSMTSMP
ncbi:hypothetical protein Tco_0688192, partial [Tanacetum coccineum]